jgi:hypothetical protein
VESFLKQINLLNCLLLAGIVAFGYFVLLPILTREAKVTLSPAAPKTAEQKKEAAEQAVNPPLQEYAVVAEKNLFHPERIIPAKKETVAIPKPEFVLYGALVTDSVSIAYLVDKKAVRSTPGRGKRQVALKLGETLSGYTLKEVLTDRAVLVHGDDRIEVMVISPEGKKDRGAIASATAPVASVPMMSPPLSPTTSTSVPMVAPPAGTPQMAPSMTPSDSMAQPPATGSSRMRSRALPR